MFKKTKTKRTLNKEKIFKAAQEIAKHSEMPTIKKIRKYLGGGSETTIHKYLTQWRENLLKVAAGIEGYSFSPLESKATWVEEKHYLEQRIDKQMAQNKVLSQDLLMAERELAKWKEQHEGKEKELAIVQKQEASLKEDYERIKIAYEVICLERDTAIEKILEDKNRLIEELRAELKATHQENLVQIREWSFQKEDVLMQEKVKTMNYAEQIKVLKEELKQVSTECERAKNALEPLRKELARQRKIIQSHGNFEVFLENEFLNNQENTL